VIAAAKLPFLAVLALIVKLQHAEPHVMTWRCGVQGVKDKEVIAGELAAAEASLSPTPRGAALMRK